VARRENPLNPAEGAIQLFAYDLRALREKTGLTYRQLAERAGYSRTTLSDAANGRDLPTLDVVQAYVGACGGNTAEWNSRWRELNDLRSAQCASVRPSDHETRRTNQALADQDPGLTTIPPATLPGPLSAATRSAMVGRDEELAWLLEAYRQIGSDTTVCRIVDGPAGIGKTRLTAALAAAYADGVAIEYAGGSEALLAWSTWRRRPAVVICDDVDHQLAAAQIGRLGEALDTTAGPLLAVLVTDHAAMSASQRDALAHIDAQRIVLGPLPPWSVAEIVTGHVTEADLPAALAAVEDLPGVPGEVHQAIRQWVGERTGNAAAELSHAWPNVDARRAAVGPAATRAAGPWSRRHDRTLTLETAADKLAELVREQWTREATARRLFYPTPILLAWRWSHRAVTGLVTEAVGNTTDARFPPLPGISQVTASMVRCGKAADLFHVYAGLDSGRLLLLGPPGAGKTASAIRVVLDALAHRQALDEPRRRSVPVPVLMTLHGWDPIRQPLRDWLTGRLVRDYPFLRTRTASGNLAGRLIDSGRIAAILDGLDDLPEGLRAVAIQAMSEQVAFRLILLSRTDELVAAVAVGHLPGAAALELLPVTAVEAATYIARCQVSPLPQPWRRLVDHLAGSPSDALAEALRTPLMLTLLRDTYQAGDNIDELLDTAVFDSREAIADHLLDRVLLAAYRPKAGGPRPGYAVRDVERWLRYVARRMTQDGVRDLAWWRIVDWAPVAGRVIATTLIGGITAAIPFSIAFSTLLPTADAIAVGGAVGFIFGVAFGIAAIVGSHQPYGSRNRRIIGGAAFGITVGLAVGLMFAAVLSNRIGFAAGAAFGIANSFIGAGARAAPQRLGRLRLRNLLSFRNVAFGVTYGATGGVIAAYADGPILGMTAGIAVAIVAPTAYAIAYPSSDISRGPVNPVGSWRSDVQYCLVTGVLLGCLFGAVFAAFFVASFGERTGLGIGGAIFILVMLAVPLGGLMGGSAVWPFFLCIVQLWIRGLVPLRLLRFLEDACDRHVLRTTGPVYQFRHARLQDRLAGAPEGQYQRRR
jgi:transcriptional regulator with XRE-family HTH domain